MNFLKKLLSLIQFKKYSKYLLLALPVFVLGLLWHFPFHRIKETVQSQIYQQTRIVTEIGNIKAAFPIGLSINYPKFFSVPLGKKSVDLELDSLKITVSPLSLITFLLMKSGTLNYSGELKSFKSYGSFYSSKKSVALENVTKNLKINDKFAFTNPTDPYSSVGIDVGVIATVSGSMSLNGSLPAFQKNDFTSAKGSMKLTIDQITLDAPILGQLTFNKATADLKVDKGLVDIKSIVLTGPQISAKASGSIKLNTYFNDSELKMDGTLTFVDSTSPLKSMVQTFGSAMGLTMDAAGVTPIKISGPISRPSIKGY